jgi:cytochrome c553
MKALINTALVVLASVVIFVIARSTLEIQDRPQVNNCTGECYSAYLAENGTIAEQARAAREAASAASPADLGKALFVTCAACHGAGGEGGIGPQLNARDAAFVTDALNTYKSNVARGPQSALMYGVAGALSDADIANLSAFVESL